MESQTLGKEHKRLEQMVGRWVGEEEMPPGQWAPDGFVAKGVSECRLALNGLAAIVDDEQSKEDHVSFAGHAVYTYDAAEGCYLLHWFDSMGKGVELFRGNFEGEVLTMESEGAVGRMRSTYDYSKPGELSSKMEMSQDGTGWAVLFEGHYRRE